MQKIISTALAGVMAATMLTAAPAFAQNGDRSDWCKFGNCDRGDRDNRWDRDRDRDRDGWKFSRRGDRDNDWRWRHRDRDRFDDNDAAGLVFGLAAGAIAGSIAGSVYQGGSYERCAATYRSFNPQTWLYLGFDGYYHRCPY